jgi:hypothetical protein
MYYNDMEFSKGSIYMYDTMSGVCVFYDDIGDGVNTSDCYEIIDLDGCFLCYSEEDEFMNFFIVLDNYIEFCEKKLDKILR